MDKIFELLFPQLKPFIVEFLTNNNCNFLVNYVEVVYWILALLSIWMTAILLKQIKNIIKKIRVKSHIVYLLNFYSKYEIYFALRYFIPTHGQDNDPSEFLEIRDALNNKIARK